MWQRISLVVVAIIGLFTMVTPVMAVDLTGNCSSTNVDCELVTEDRLNMSNRTTIANAIRWALWVLAAISVIIIVISGFQFVISQGNADSVRRARNAIIYSVVGLVVALFASAMVQYVVDSLL